MNNTIAYNSESNCIMKRKYSATFISIILNDIEKFGSIAGLFAKYRYSFCYLGSKSGPVYKAGNKRSLKKLAIVRKP